MPGHEQERDAFADRVFVSALGYFDVLTIHLGQRLGLYRARGGGGGGGAPPPPPPPRARGPPR
jgi:hypothetical protein